MRPLISVIIPVYNHAATLERTLLSLAKQTYRPLEVIIVDDGSTDSFLETMRHLHDKEPIKSLHGKVIVQEHADAGAARNRGFKESTGSFVIFWDADTIAKSTMLEKMMAVLLVHDTAAYVYSRYRYGWKRMKSQTFDPAALRRYNYIDTTSLLRRSAFPGFDSSLKRFQDWDLWLTLLARGREGIFLSETLYTKIKSNFRREKSAWLPSFLYRLPFKIKRVRAFEQAKDIILKKHRLPQ